MPSSGKMSFQQLQTFLRSEEPLTTTLITLATDRYGLPEITDWAIETLVLEINTDFRIELPQLSVDRLGAGVLLLTSDRFYRQLPDFINIGNVLAGTPFDPDQWDPLEAAEAAWAISEALLLAPPDEDDENPFSEDITAYLGHVLDREGIDNPPDVLRIATRTATAGAAADYSDDPIMFESIYTAQQEKSDDISAGLRYGVQRLIGQLDALPLTHGDVTKVKAAFHR